MINAFNFVRNAKTNDIYYLEHIKDLLSFHHEKKDKGLKALEHFEREAQSLRKMQIEKSNKELHIMYKQGKITSNQAINTLKKFKNDVDKSIETVVKKQLKMLNKQEQKRMKKIKKIMTKMKLKLNNGADLKKLENNTRRQIRTIRIKTPRHQARQNFQKMYGKYEHTRHDNNNIRYLESLRQEYPIGHVLDDLDPEDRATLAEVRKSKVYENSLKKQIEQLKKNFINSSEWETSKKILSKTLNPNMVHKIRTLLTNNYVKKHSLK